MSWSGREKKKNKDGKIWGDTSRGRCEEEDEEEEDCTLKSVLLMHSKTNAGVLDCSSSQNDQGGRNREREENKSRQKPFITTSIDSIVWLVTDWTTETPGSNLQLWRLCQLYTSTTTFFLNTQLQWLFTNHWVFDYVHQSDDVGSSAQVLQDLDLTLDLLLLYRLMQQTENTGNKYQGFFSSFVWVWDLYIKKIYIISKVCYYHPDSR